MLFTPEPHPEQGLGHRHVPTTHLLALPGPGVRALDSDRPGCECQHLHLPCDCVTLGLGLLMGKMGPMAAAAVVSIHETTGVEPLERSNSPTTTGTRVINPALPSCKNLQVFPGMDTAMTLFSRRRQAVRALGCLGLAKHAFWLVSLSSASLSGKQGLIPLTPTRSSGPPCRTGCGGLPDPRLLPLEDATSSKGNSILPSKPGSSTESLPSLQRDHHMLIHPISWEPGEPWMAETQSWPCKGVSPGGRDKGAPITMQCGPASAGAYERGADPHRLRQPAPQGHDR